MSLRIVLAVLGTLLLLGVGLFAGATPGDEAAAFILWQLRLPRVLVGALVGAILGMVGAAFQTIFHNPLATPSTVGTTAGATLGALLALVFDVPFVDWGLPVTTLFSFAGALAASLLVATVAARARMRVSDVLLAGIAITLAAGAISQGIQHVADMRALFAATQWSLGQLPQVGYAGVALLAPFAAVTLVTLLSQLRGLETLVAGEELAHARGVHVPRLRTLVLLVGSLGVAACVAWCGPIAFVGLLVPHLTRLVLSPRLRVLLPMSGVLGAAFLVVCDTVARSILPGRELPVGVLTAALGAPALFLLVARRRS